MNCNHILGFYQGFDNIYYRERVKEILEQEKILPYDWIKFNFCPICGEKIK